MVTDTPSPPPAALPPVYRVSPVSFRTAAGKYAGRGTRVEFTDGYRITYMGRVSKREASSLAVERRELGLPSEVQS